MLRKLAFFPGFLFYQFKKFLDRQLYLFQVYLFQRENPSVKIGRNVTIKNIKALKVGKNVTIDDNCYLHCGGMEWCNNTGGIEIGDDVNIGNACIIWGTGAKVIIGSNITLAQEVHIYASTEYRESAEPLAGKQWYKFRTVHLKDGCGIYSKVVITPGVTVGTCSRIGASSVVLNSIDEYVLASGNPAVAIKNIGWGRKTNAINTLGI